MRAMGLALVLALLGGCAETVRCPDGEVFDEDGECVPIDELPRDAGRAADAGSGDT